METKQILNAATGTGASASQGYLIERHPSTGSEVQVFLVFTGGTASIEGSADGVTFAPIADGQFSASQIVPVDLAEGTYLRVSYAGVTTISAIVKPKSNFNG